MRVLCPLGNFKDSHYENGKILTRNTAYPSIWGVFMKFAQNNKDRGYFYFAVMKKSSTPGEVDFLPLEGINGTLMVIHVKGHSFKGFEGQADMVVDLISAFSYKDTILPVDVVLLPYPTIASNLVEGLDSSDAKTRTSHRPLVAVRTCDGLEDTGRGNVSYLSYDRSSTFAYASADLILTNGAQMIPAMSKIGKKYLAFSQVKEMREKSEYISHGVRLPEVELNFDREKVVGYFGRFSVTDKKVDEVLEVFDTLYSRGKVDKVVTTSSKKSDGSSPLLEQYPYVTFSAEGQDYVNKAMEARATITHYNGLSCPLGMIELMGYGVVPIVPRDRYWSKYFFKEEYPDYPLLFSNKKEAVAMLEKLMEDDEYYKTIAEKLVGIVHERFELRVLKRKMFDTLKEKHNDFAVKSYPSFRLRNLEEKLQAYGFYKEIKEIADGWEGDLHFGDFMEKVTGSVTYVIRGGIHLADAKAIYNFLLELGYTDTMSTPIPILKKEA